MDRPVTAILLTLFLTAAVPASAQSVDGRGPDPLGLNSFWHRPLTYLDYYLLTVRDHVREHLAPLDSSFWQDILVPPAHGGTDPPDFSAFVDPASGAVLFQIGLTVASLKKPAKDVCRIAFAEVSDAFGVDDFAHSHPQIRENRYSRYLPPSSRLNAAKELRLKAYDQLEHAEQLRAVIYLVSSREGYTCTQLLLGDSIAVAREDLSQVQPN